MINDGIYIIRLQQMVYKIIEPFPSLSFYLDRINSELIYCYTQRNLFEILLNQTEIGLYLPFSNWFVTANGQCPFAVPNQSLKMVKYNLISVWFNKIWNRFLCVWTGGQFRAKKLSSKYFSGTGTYIIIKILWLTIAISKR